MEESYGLQDYADGSPVFSVDPVCGTEVDEARAAGKTGHAGQMYYFCSRDCQIKFEEDPGLYTGESKGPATPFGPGVAG